MATAELSVAPSAVIQCWAQTPQNTDNHPQHYSGVEITGFDPGCDCTVSGLLTAPLLGAFRCERWGDRLRPDSTGRQYDAPGKQRLVVVRGLCEWQCHEQGLQIAIRVDSVDLARL